MFIHLLQREKKRRCVYLHRSCQPTIGSFCRIHNTDCMHTSNHSCVQVPGAQQRVASVSALLSANP